MYYNNIVMENGKYPKFVRWAVLIGIVVVLNLFFFAGRSFITPEPTFDTFCDTKHTVINTQSSCEEKGGMWNPYQNEEGGYCDMYAKCQPLYDAAWKEHQLHAFIFMTIFGVLALIAGVLPLGSSIVSAGLSYGGVVALIIASFSYWADADNFIRLSISFFALVALLYIGIKKFKD